MPTFQICVLIFTTVKLTHVGAIREGAPVPGLKGQAVLSLSGRYHLTLCDSNINLYSRREFRVNMRKQAKNFKMSIKMQASFLCKSKDSALAITYKHAGSFGSVLYV